MKRTKEQTEREIENEERQAMFAHEISDAMRTHGSVLQKALTVGGRNCVWLVSSLTRMEFT